jgi:hypothetical protein
MSQSSSEPIHPRVVYHVAAMGNWKEVVAEQLLTLRMSGLTAEIAKHNEHISVTFVGDMNGIRFLNDEAARQDAPIKIVRSDPNVMHYETFAMLEIEQIAKATDRHIMYIHTKGVSVPGCGERVLWRKVMMRYVAEMWRENCEVLSSGDYDAVGWNWWNCESPHFSGTFWMARADWIRQLPDFVAWHHQNNLVRYSCELWIGSNHNCRPCSRGVRDHQTFHGGYDFRPYLVPVEDKITWLSASSYSYANELGALASSFRKVGPGHRFKAAFIDEVYRWDHRNKLRIIRNHLDNVTTEYAFWIDADCQFLCPLSCDELIAPNKITVIEHIVYDSDADAPGFTQELREMSPGGTKGYWQACLWGGPLDLVMEVLEFSSEICANNPVHDEHALNLWIQRNPGRYRTLPCRYAAVQNFSRMPAGYEDKFNARCGGAARIIHRNSEINRS